MGRYGRRREHPLRDVVHDTRRRLQDGELHINISYSFLRAHILRSTPHSYVKATPYRTAELHGKDWLSFSTPQTPPSCPAERLHVYLSVPSLVRYSESLLPLPLPFSFSFFFLLCAPYSQERQFPLMAHAGLPSHRTRKTCHGHCMPLESSARVLWLNFQVRQSFPIEWAPEARYLCNFCAIFPYRLRNIVGMAGCHGRHILFEHVSFVWSSE